MSTYQSTDPDNQGTDPDHMLQGEHRISDVLALMFGKMEICMKRMEALKEHTAPVADKLRAMEDEEQQKANHQRQLDV
jgi:hypothetical protein